LKNAQKLAAKSLEANLNEFVQLTTQVTTLLRNEAGRVGSMTVTGRLVRAPPGGEAIVVGDLHGDLETLLSILKASEFLQKAERNEQSFLVFLGDYGDRGIFSAEVYYIVLTLKANFPQHVVLMRGNHEGPEDLIASPHDLPNHLQNRFGENWSEAYLKLKALFSHLYTAVVVEDRCILLHGGVPSAARALDDVAYAHAKHPNESHLEEILWSDPEEGLKGTYPSPRGAGRLFGQDVTERFLKLVSANVLIRGHEPADAGYKINHGGRVLTLFSRRGEPYFNSQGAFLQFSLAEKVEDAFQLKRFVKQL